MPPMRRDEQGRCRKKRGGIAGQTKRRCDPPRTETWSFRTTADRYDRLEAMITAGGYNNRADAVDDAVALMASLLRQEPLPHWVAIAELRNNPKKEN